jgi:hypothetical protein
MSSSLIAANCIAGVPVPRGPLSPHWLRFYKDDMLPVLNVNTKGTKVHF